MFMLCQCLSLDISLPLHLNSYFLIVMQVLLRQVQFEEREVSREPLHSDVVYHKSHDYVR